MFYNTIHYSNFCILLYSTLLPSVVYYVKLHCSNVLHTLYFPQVLCTRLHRIVPQFCTQLHYTTLHYIVSVYYFTLHWSHVLCTTLHYFAPRGSVPVYYTKVHCSQLIVTTLQHTAKYCVLRYTTLFPSVV